MTPYPHSLHGSPLTDQQYQIAKLVADDYSNEEIATRMWLSVRTVEGHLYRLFHRLNIQRRAELRMLMQSEKAIHSEASRCPTCGRPSTRENPLPSLGTPV